jgi:3-dehydroquinate synthetase
MLNFGHTFGHALETMNSYSNNLTHGEAISIGMSLAAKISNKIGTLSNKDYQKLILHFKKTKLPTSNKRIKNNKLYKLMLSDKKNSNNRINLILLKKIGLAYFNREMKKEDIKRILK